MVIGALKYIKALNMAVQKAKISLYAYLNECMLQLAKIITWQMFKF
jgi:hypothetical protein